MKMACVVIPIYKTTLNRYELISLEQCFRVLSNHDIFVASPAGIKSELSRQAFFSGKRVEFKSFSNKFFKDIAGYNKLLKYPGFYADFSQYKYMLIYQLDAFVFSDELEYWCQKDYDNIGAPLFEGYEDPDDESAIIGQGNGGFCLRNVQKCYKVVSSVKKLDFRLTFSDPQSPFYINWLRFIKHRFIYNYSKYPFQPIVNEDIFWSELVPDVYKDFRVPSPEEAIAFSFEANPHVLYRMNADRLPFGCHAWAKYNFNFWRKFIEAYGYEL